MTSTKLKAKIVRVEFKRGKSGLFLATSPDLRGLLVAERDMNEFDRSVPAAITDLYAACGEKVVVTRAEDGEKEGDQAPWIAFPVELARLALSEQATR